MSKTNIDLNQTSCLVHQQSIGERIVTNICSGEVTNIPWTAGDWLNAGALTGLSIILAAVVIGLIILIVSAFRN